MRYDTVLLDNDGVIIEPPDHDAILAAIRTTFKEFGVENPPDSHVEQLLGVTESDLLSICQTHDLDPEEFWYRRDMNAAGIQRRSLNAGHRKPYADLYDLLKIDCNFGVVSNNQHITIEYITETFDLDFATHYGREPTVEGVRRKKPNPYYLKQAIDELDAETPLYVGDSNNDLGAAEALGIDSVFVRRDHRKEYELNYEPTYEVTDLNELATKLNGKS